MQDKIFILPSRGPVESKPALRSNLPAQLTSFIGREQEVAAVCALLRRSEVRLLTLTGPGGVGKTRLSLHITNELLDDFADGVSFVPLAPIFDPDFVLPTIAQTLGLKEAQNQPLSDLLKETFQNLNLLLFLDNFEQVIAAAPLLVDLLASCPQLKILVTSRAVLRIQGEYEFPVGPLAIPDLKQLPDSASLTEYAAVALFLQRVQAFKPDFQIKPTNAQAITEICTRLDGLPLAIELAAARIKLLPPQALLARLEHRLQVLTSGVRNAPARQQTLRNTIEWSYDLLDVEEQRLFRRLSIFVGGCTLEAIEAISTMLDGSDRTGQVLDGVASLIDKSLLQQTDQEEPRLVMLETIREYALEALGTAGEVEAIRHAHAAYYLQLAQEAESELFGPQQSFWLERLEQEYDNLRAVLEWALEEMTGDGAKVRKELSLRLCGALEPFWVMHGHYSEARAFLERSIIGSEGESASLRVRVLQATANIVYRHGDFDRAEALVQQSLALWRELGDTRGIANALSLLAVVANMRGNAAEAFALSEEQVRLMQQIGEPGEVARALFFLADEVSMRGEYGRGQILFEEALLLFRKAGNELWIGGTLVWSAFYLWWSASSDVAMVRQRLQQGRTHISRVGDRNWIAHSSLVAALVALSEGETARAYDLAQESLAIYQEMDSRRFIAVMLDILGRVEAQRSDLREARSRFLESLALAQKLGEKWIIPFDLEGLAEVLARQGEFRSAAQLWGAAEVRREGTAVAMPAANRPAYERAVVSARVQLGEQAFAAAWQEGRTMTLEQVLTTARSVALSTVGSNGQPSTSTAKSLPTYPDGLTAREVEVLRLVARGLTNAQVAEQLVISPRTVNWYLTSIYSKLQVTSRSAATRIAIEHRMV